MNVSSSEFYGGDPLDRPAISETPEVEVEVLRFGLTDIGFS